MSVAENSGIENGVERAEKAVEALVYGTVGLALYVRDTAPSFIKLFVARGKNELGQQGKSVGDQLGQVKNVNLGDQLGQVKALGDMAAQSAPQILRVVGDQVGRLRERAEDVIAGFGAPPPGAARATAAVLAGAACVRAGSQPPAPPDSTDTVRDRGGRCGRVGNGHRDQRQSVRRPADVVALFGRDRYAAERHRRGDRPRDHRLRRALGLAGRRPARRSPASRARSDPRLRARAPRPQHDPRQDRAADPLVPARSASTAMEHARPAVEADLPRIVELAEALRAELRPMRGGRALVPARAREPLDVAYGALVDDPDALLAVGTIDDVVLGFAAVHVETLRDGGALGVVTDLFVEPDARSVGIGEALVGLIVEFCAARGCIGIDAAALPGHRAAKNFFEGHGFTARSLVMHRSLHEPRSEPERP